MRRFVTWSIVAVVALGVAGEWVRAADQTILGRSLIVRNPSIAERRRIASAAKEKASPNVLVGNPTLAGSAGGAILTVTANGISPTMQTFNLAQGNSIVTGKPFWRTIIGGNGYKYRDGKGEQGPVRTVLIKRSPDGVFVIKASILGKNGPLDVVPPNPGTDGYLTLELGGGGDRYCVQFGADGQVINKNSKLFKVRRPKLEGCPAGPSTTTTTTSTTATTSTSTTTTTVYSSPSRAFLDVPPDLLH